MAFNENISEPSPVYGGSRIRILAIAAFGITILSLGGLQTSEFRQSQNLRDALAKSYQMRATIDTLLSLHQDAETGQRGYLLTGNVKFLEPYTHARPRIPVQLAELHRLAIERGSGFNASVNHLSLTSRQKMAFVNRTLSLRERGDSRAAIALVASGEGKAIMDRYRGWSAKLDQTEEQRLRDITRQSDQSFRSAQIETFGLEFVLGLLLALAAWVISRTLAAERGIARQFADLSARQVSIFEAATDGMVTHDAHGFIESLNRSAEELFGYEPGELVGKHIDLLFDDPPKRHELERFFSRLKGLEPGKGAPVREQCGRRSDGSKIYVDVANSAVLSRGAGCFLAVIRDATDRKRVDTMKNNFVATVSHELRTPLTSIAGSLGLLVGGVGGPLPKQASKLISIAHANSERLVRLINDILDIEKIEAGEINFNLKTLALRPMLEEVLHGVAGYADEHGVNIRFVPGGEDASVIADHDRLIQIITNLLSNAAKFSPRGADVLVSITPKGHHYRVTVSDSGPGISDEFRPRIFSKFAQADSSDTRTKSGTGLGLSISKELALRMGGDVSFDTGPAGSDFHVDIPASVGTAGLARGGSILIGGAREFAQEFGEALKIRHVMSDAADSAAGVTELAATRPYAAIVLDLTSLEGDVDATIRGLRGNPLHLSTPILLASADRLQGTISQTVAIANWLQKPLSASDVAATVASIPKAQEVARPSILHVEDDADVVRVVSSAFNGRADLQCAPNLDAARAALAAREFDLIILDIGLPGSSGLELLPIPPRRDGTHTPVVIFSAQDGDAAATRLVEAFLVKSRATLDDLVNTVTTLIGKPTSDAKSTEGP